ncbi:MAG: NADH-quinone oxidoreductase subunit A [Chlamydiales bacterium]|jgi:NADH-quinone oxidoreductase subunit A
MYFDYLNVLVFCSVGLVFVFANMIVGSIIRPRRKTKDGLEIYECGEETIGDAWIQFDIRYYTVALIYVIFAVEIAFLFPWAMVLTEAFQNPAIGAYALWKGVLFVTILFLGLAAVWVKGDLDWVLTYEGTAYVPTAERTRKQAPTMDELVGSEDEPEPETDPEVAA